MLEVSRTDGYHCQPDFKITKEQWMLLLNDEEIITEQDIRLFEVMYDCFDSNVTGKQLSQKLEMTNHRPLNSQVARLGRRIAAMLEIPDSNLIYGRVKRWIIPFCGKRTRDGYCWRLRPELWEAMHERWEKNHSGEKIYSQPITNQL